MLSAVSAAGVNRFFQNGRDDATLVQVWTVRVRRVDPPIGEDSTVAVACI